MNVRCGTIVKRWLNEIEKVKKKSRGPAQEAESSKNCRLHLQGMLFCIGVLKYLMLEDKLKADDLSTRSIRLLQACIRANQFYKPNRCN